MTKWPKRGNIGTVLPGHEDPPIGHWRLSGAKLKEIVNLSWISESGANRSPGRSESGLGKDKYLEEELLQMVEDLK